MKVSYIISSIGKSRKLNELLNSLIKHLNENEIILIDNSENKALQQYKKNKAIHYYHEEKTGLSNARNRGAKEASNELLVFLDDDIIPKSSFFGALNSYANNKSLKAIVGGKIIPKEIPKFLPIKYQYIAGMKDFGDDKKILSKYKYLGGCLLVMTKETFNKVNGFNNNFGHDGSKLGANEDVLIQDIARKNDINMIYDPKLYVIHYWTGNYEVAIKRIKIQGKSDYLLDKKYHKIRLFLKLIKYKLFIVLKKKSSDLTDIYDIVRYKSYVNYKRNR
jgi:glucosyl-dolichyl phosphate glucuronosyltransferase